ncbi:MAG TPA: porin [Cyanobacteria bacterium UBA8803]|nr:porin [Cyanobacteria bacterium UBA8803]
MQVVPLQAIADEVSDSVAISAMPQKAMTVTGAGKVPTLGDITSVAQLSSDAGELDRGQGDVTTPGTTVGEVDPIDVSTGTPTLEEITSVTQLSAAEGDIKNDDSMSQVTNVSQLRDVSPGDWAYEALRSLVERYGCIAGYPDGTFRGNRAMTRYEFAAGLNACLQQIERLISPTPDNQGDLETLQRLVQEFQAELTALGARVDNLEGRVAFLEDHQFSTTTKLNGLVFMNLTGAFADDDVRVETINLDPPFGDLALRQAGRTATGRPAVRVKTDDPEITFSNLAWLTLNTSFTGRDSLVTQLAAGNGESPANDFASAGLFNSFGTPFTDQTAGINNGVNDVIIRELFYSFPVGDKLQVVVGPRVNWYRYFDANAFTFFLTGAGSFNSIGSTLTNTIDRGSGAIAVWNFNQKFKLAVGYLGENTEFLPGEFGFNTASNPSKGLFSPTNTASAELTFSPTDKINVRLIYNYSNIDPNVPIFDENGNITGFGVGGATGEPIYGVADDGFGGSISNAIAHSFGINFDWLITRGIGVFGRYTYGITNIDPKTPGRDDGQIEAQSLQLGVAFRDLGKEGALFSLSYLIPFSVLDGRNFLVAGGGDGGVQYEFEAAYFYPVTNNIALVPSFYLIGNPNNFSDNPNIYVGNLRAQFSF